MFAPLVRKTIAITGFVFLAACGSKDGGKKENPITPPPTDTKLHLKSEGVKKVLIGRVVDLRKFLVNHDFVVYDVVEGMPRMEWAEPSVPKVKFKEMGEIKIDVTDEKNQITVQLQFLVMPDTLELDEDIDLDPGPIPVNPN